MIRLIDIILLVKDAAYSQGYYEILRYCDTLNKQNIYARYEPKRIDKNFRDIFNAVAALIHEIQLTKYNLK